MVLPLTFAGNPVLYKKCKEVPVKDIQSAKIQSFLRDLGDTINHYKHAAGLAAPQVGKELRIFGLKLDKKSMDYTVLTPKTFSMPSNEPFFFINPKLEFPTPATDEMGEGCLSIPFYHVYVDRFLEAKVSGYTKEGTYFEIMARGLYARYIQHEVDHLNGILLFQRAKHIEDIVFDTDED